MNATANRIIEISPAEKTCAAKGLSHFTMGKLGATVVLAGPNGGGKSRLLDIVAHLATHAEIKPTSGHRIILQAPQEPPRRVLRIFPDTPSLTPIDQYTSRALNSAADALCGDLFTSSDLANGTIAYIDRLSRNYLSAIYPGSQFSDEKDRAKVVADWESLSAQTKQLLGHPLTPTLVDGAFVIFGQPIAQLSPGQRILLQISVALHRDSLPLNGSLMFIDEPEKHLHPSATAQVLKALRRLNPDGQIWIATHSIHVLSMFAPEDIWLVENGFARWVGKNPESALRSLIGDEDAQLRLVDFLAFPAAFAATQFAGECLGAPPVAMTPAHDPQANQVRIAVQKLAELKGRLRVLDWGAGKGRLAAALAGLDVDYLAYEPNSQTREECLRNVANHFQASDATVFSNFSRTLDLNASVDVVVLCNVLHEIDPADWLTCFGPDGHISNVLHDDGHLLVVEDYRLPHGEKAHAHGFLLLDRDELQKMFAAGESEIITSAVTGRENRLRAHLISRSAVIRYGNETRAPALETLKTRAMAEMSDIGQREKTTINYHSGREYALWVHLFANASLALATAGKE